MYKSPIDKIYSELETQVVQEEEKMIIKAVRDVGINVDKEELMKAIQYDRSQYTKGYEEGKNEVLDKIRAEIIEMRSKQNVGVLECLDIIDKYRAESEG